ncbi:aspartate aminotransferase family protein [Achromobacter denitrificans]|jgi:beta-alanine--pyruvate transaminase|uniref:Aspartate aminotransferase family protein n=2 Tax=Achromobacter denitrificans TaxID=32002 RepID=A0ABZ3G7G4_ACHDE|nr:aspartate aminotransferase family protein [Achromobacter denitrificans]MDX3881221.1 aspartate aminotransferase family protein [Achromobacter sp.]ASC63270.1 aspartate aminotransferase family protein [Achromobacter denitrificans]MBV2162481.1 aspartate aminotransferase family protein [Achromobacter denitrificans]MDF3847142.1 aspartate aminotransferase family protein [Achromobacter denitrificans]MDF3860946.1 aspartate aminotransferase family protein [Achromobacter denitrificans]
MSPQIPSSEAYWLPFTSNRRFKRNPVIFSGAQDMYYFRPDGSEVLDGIAGLWCVNAGHGRPEIVRAISRAAADLDYASSFQMSHPLALRFADELIQAAPAGFSQVFFSNSGSEAVDTALKIALGYHRARGDGQRVRLIGRERSYHGVGFGGLSVSGIAGHRKPFGNLLPFVDHLPHTYDREKMAYTRGQPEWGAHLADALERIVALHDASTIAAVIVEPVAGSTGVLVPPRGYLQRLREICDKYGILLIFDEVICGFGRIGGAYSASHFDVMPDIITSAKGLTNGAVPMGATLVREHVYEAFMQGPESAIELSHGYTYSGHPVACAAGLATLDIARRENLFERAGELGKEWEDAAHSLKGAPHVVDVRNIGLLAAIELAPEEGKPGQRGYAVHQACLERDCLIRSAGDTMLLSPPLTIERHQMDRLFSTLHDALRSLP